MDTAFIVKPRPDQKASTAIGNGKFLQDLFQAVLALGASAALLVSGYIFLASGLVSQHGSNANADQISPRIIKGSELSLRYGKGAQGLNESFILTGLKDRRAIITRNLSLNASDYPFLEYTLTGSHPGETVYFIWKTADEPLAVSNAPLNWNGDKTTLYSLAKHPEWKGRIIEAGFDIYGDMRDQPLVVSGLSFLPNTWHRNLSAIWFDWTVYRGWTQKSVNYLLGTPKNPTLSPTLAMACWGGLALLLLAGAYLFTRRHTPAAYLAVIFIPWIALDLLWQSNISTQLEDTKYLFAGKTQHEKHLAGRDKDLYLYTRYLMSEVLPEAGKKRIFLLHNLENETYPRLKAQHYLLPQNIYNYGHFPNKKKIVKGDYILALGEITGLDYDPRNKTLNWANKSLRVKLVDTHPQGQLYKVVGRKNSD